MISISQEVFAVVLLGILILTPGFFLHSKSLHITFVEVSTNLGARAKFSMALSKSVAFTRELGANKKIIEMLPECNCVELPCIMFEEGPDIPELEKAIPDHDLIVITSPQAAKVFVDSWKNVGSPSVKVATVGKGTSEHLIPVGIVPVFEPSQSTASVLARELPKDIANNILYPASILADDKLANGLEERGFRVSDK